MPDLEAFSFLFDMCCAGFVSVELGLLWPLAAENIWKEVGWKSLESETWGISWNSHL